ncbi:hypothetical protein FVE85_2226 [Porphyridium purpureum]|uniref:Uncharacterized protein n=1 Tax=Porphyridium purpureum TaxID=35688 RepID=A0A5J4YWX3_PORPP|nr:hypothetical protein FVE85_2226 [Porphyridium purpureum]|eukprot:POR4418..scf209_3
MTRQCCSTTYKCLQQRQVVRRLSANAETGAAAKVTARTHNVRTVKATPKLRMPYMAESLCRIFFYGGELAEEGHPSAEMYGTRAFRSANHHEWMSRSELDRAGYAPLEYHPRRVSRGVALGIGSTRLILDPAPDSHLVTKSVVSAATKPLVAVSSTRVSDYSTSAHFIMMWQSLVVDLSTSEQERDAVRLIAPKGILRLMQLRALLSKAKLNRVDLSVVELLLDRMSDGSDPASAKHDHDWHSLPALGPTQTPLVADVSQVGLKRAVAHVVSDDDDCVVYACDGRSDARLQGTVCYIVQEKQLLPSFDTGKIDMPRLREKIPKWVFSMITDGIEVTVQKGGATVATLIPRDVLGPPRRGRKVIMLGNFVDGGTADSLLECPLAYDADGMVVRIGSRNTDDMTNSLDDTWSVDEWLKRAQTACNFADALNAQELLLYGGPEHHSIASQLTSRLTSMRKVGDVRLMTAGVVSLKGYFGEDKYRFEQEGFTPGKRTGRDRIPKVDVVQFGRLLRWQSLTSCIVDLDVLQMSRQRRDEIRAVASANVAKDPTTARAKRGLFFR